MATVIETIKRKKDERGITLAELARRCDMDYDALRNSLEEVRNLRATEFLAMCRELELSIDDFDNAD